MVVGKLRMKTTEEDARSNQMYKSRKIRHPTRSPSIDPPPAPYGHGKNELDEFPSGSSSVSRATTKGKSRADEHSSGVKADDELVIQWTTTSSSLANQLLSIPSSTTSTSEFELKLRDALSAENDDLRLESLLNDDLYLPRRWKDRDGWKHPQSDLNGRQLSQLEPQEYEEYIRKRMWSQSNRKHYLSSKHQEEQQRQEEAGAQERSKRRKAEAKLRAERDAKRELRVQTKHRQRCRERYAGRWEMLNSLINADRGGSDPKEPEVGGERRQRSDEAIRQVLDFEEIPWPVYPADEQSHPGSSGIGIERLTRSAIRDFLLGHLPAGDQARTPAQQAQSRKIVRNALLAYHPDRFDRLVLRVKDSDHAPQKAREWGLRVSQILNELNQSIDEV